MCWIAATISIIWYGAAIIHEHKTAGEDATSSEVTVGELMLDLLLFLQLNSSVYSVVTLYPSAITKATKVKGVYIEIDII